MDSSEDPGGGDCSPTALGRRVVCRVVEVRGRDGPGACSYGHQVGAEWQIGETCPAGLCAWAFNALYPFATALRFGGTLPWEPERDRARVSCPDPDNTVVFELRVTDPPPPASASRPSGT